MSRNSLISRLQVETNLQIIHQTIMERGGRLVHQSPHNSRYYEMSDGQKIRVSDHDQNPNNQDWRMNRGAIHLRTDRDDVTDQIDQIPYPHEWHEGDRVLDSTLVYHITGPARSRFKNCRNVAEIREKANSAETLIIARTGLGTRLEIKRKRSATDHRAVRQAMIVLQAQFRK